MGNASTCHAFLSEVGVKWLLGRAFEAAEVHVEVGVDQRRALEDAAIAARVLARNLGGVIYNSAKPQVANGSRKLFRIHMNSSLNNTKFRSTIVATTI